MAQTIPYLHRNSVPTPNQGCQYLFYDLDNESVLTYKDSQGFFKAINHLPASNDLSKVDDCICEALNQVIDDAGCALKNTTVNATEYQSIINNFNLFSVVTVDPSTGSYSHNITNKPTLFVSLTTTNVLCNGESTGTASLVVTGGVGPYTIVWEDTLGATVNPAALAAGAYVAIVTDSLGTVRATTFVITEPAALIIMSVPVLGSSPTATATVLAAGGIPPYAYNWKDSVGIPIGQTAQTAVGLSTGTYQIEVTDANGCTVENTNVVIP